MEEIIELQQERAKELTRLVDIQNKQINMLLTYQQVSHTLIILIG